MKEISIEESLDFYLTTLSYLDEKYINGSDDDLKYYILEELDVDAHTFLHQNTVNKLIDKKLIPKSIAEETDNLRSLIKILIEEKSSVEEIRYDPEWKKAREIAKDILEKINAHTNK